jgi:two-component system, OmpR family, phosphate regulon sensor histidine kinase PhoR
MWRRRLFWKLTLAYSLVSVLCMAGMGSYLVRKQRRVVQQQLVEQLERSARLVDVLLAPQLDFAQAEAAEQRVDSLGVRIGARITVIHPDGRVLADSWEKAARMENHRFRPEVAEALAGRRGSNLRVSATVGQRFLYVAIPSASQPGWVVRVAMPFDQFLHHVRAETNVLLLGTAVAAALAILLSVAVARHITRPLHAMRENLQRLERGEFGVKLEPAGSDEIGLLARSLNLAQERLEQTIHNLTSQRNERDVVLASMTEGLLAVDADEHVLLINASARALLGLNFQPVENRPLLETVRYPAFERFVREVRFATGPMNTQVVLHGPGLRWLDLRGAPLRLPADAGIGAVIVFSDVTRLHKLEQARKDFVANVSHELKTPVTSIKGFLETLLDGGALDDPEHGKRFLGKISKHTERLSAIIDDLLYLSRLEHEGEEIPRRAVNLGGVVESSLADFEQVARAREVSIEAEVEGPHRVQGDESLLRRALDNLVDNAIKYSRPAGRVQVRLRRQGESVLLEVRDQGIGIPELHLPRITERFYRVDAGRSREMGGTGLGLAIVKHVALVHRGVLQVTSTEGKGSQFTLRLPAAPV